MQLQNGQHPAPDISSAAQAAPSREDPSKEEGLPARAGTPVLGVLRPLAPEVQTARAQESLQPPRSSELAACNGGQPFAGTPEGFQRRLTQGECGPGLAKAGCSDPSGTQASSALPHAAGAALDGKGLEVAAQSQATLRYAGAPSQIGTFAEAGPSNTQV